MCTNRCYYISNEWHVYCLLFLFLSYVPSFFFSDSKEYARLKEQFLSLRITREFYTRDEIFREHWKAIQVKNKFQRKIKIMKGFFIRMIKKLINLVDMCQVFLRQQKINIRKRNEVEGSFSFFELAKIWKKVDVITSCGSLSADVIITETKVVRCRKSAASTEMATSTSKLGRRSKNSTRPHSIERVAEFLFATRATLCSPSSVSSVGNDRRYRSGEVVIGTPQRSNFRKCDCWRAVNHPSPCGMGSSPCPFLESRHRRVTGG